MHLCPRIVNYFAFSSSRRMVQHGPIWQKDTPKLTRQVPIASLCASRVSKRRSSMTRPWLVMLTRTAATQPPLECRPSWSRLQHRLWCTRCWSECRVGVNGRSRLNLSNVAIRPLLRVINNLDCTCDGTS